MIPARKKRRVRFSKESPFPVPVSSITGEPVASDHWFYYTGYLQGRSVIVQHSGDISFLYKMGFFGKGNLSRSQPDFNNHFRTARVPIPGTADTLIQPRVVSRRLHKRHIKWSRLAACEDLSSSSDDGFTDEEMEEFTEQKQNKYSENTEFNIENSHASQHSDCVEHVDSSTVDRVTVLDRDEKVELKEQSQNDASWEEEEVEDDWRMDVCKDERTEAEKSWDLSTGDRDFWSEKPDGTQTNRTEIQLKHDSFEKFTATSVISDANIADFENTAVCDVLQETSKCQQNVITSNQNKSQMPEKSEHFLTTYVTLKDNVNEADRIKFKDSSSPTQKNKTDDGKDASEVEQSETNDKCSAPTDAEDSQLLQNGRELKQNICDEIQLESQNLQPVDAVSSSSLEGTVTGNDQSEALSFDSSCFDETNGDVLVINDSDNENGEQERHGRSRKTKWRPVLKRDLYPVVEHLQLSLEEAFFLTYGLGCLVVKNDNQESLGLSYLWNHFCDVQKTFLPNYIAYHHFRSKGWVPKSGLKFGCDFILYREGPPFYHGSYSVVVRLVDEQTLQDSTYHNTRCLSWTSLSGLNRITEHVAKELLICYVIKPRDITPERLASPKCILDFSVQEVHVSRWISSQEREKKEEEEFP